MHEPPEIIHETWLLLDGYVYVRSFAAGNRTYWDCHKLRRNKCKAETITVHMGRDSLIVTKGPKVSEYSHNPNREFAEA